MEQRDHRVQDAEPGNQLADLVAAGERLTTARHESPGDGGDA